MQASVLARAKEKLQARFWREGAQGSLVVHLRKDGESEAGFEVWVAFAETQDSHDVRDEVREALGLPGGVRR